MTLIATVARGLIAVLLLTSTGWAAGDPPAPAAKAAPLPHFTVEPAKFDLSPGKDSDSRVFIITGIGLPADADIDLVRDVAKQEASPFKATFTRRGTYGGTEPRRWSYVAEFAGLGSSYSQKRQLGFVLNDGKEYFADYEVSNRPSGNADYTVTSDDKWWVVSPTAAFKLTVRANDHAVGAVTLASSTLAIEKRTTTIPVTALALCANRAGTTCDPVPALKPNTPTEIYLRVASGTRSDPDPALLPAGSFSGKLKLEAAGVSTAKEVALSLVSTRPNAHWHGLLAIVVGVLVSIVVLALRFRAAQLNAFEPLARARDRITRLLEVFAGYRTTLQAGDVTKVETYYRDEVLARIAAEQPDRLNFLKAFIGISTPLETAATTDIQNRTLGLAVMVLEGAAKSTSVQQIRDLGNDPQALKTETDARTLCQRVLQAPKVSVGAPAQVPISTEEIGAFQVRAGMASAVLYVIVATLVGYFVMIDDRPGFGSLADYIMCFFWGLGVPATLQGIKDITRDKLGDSIKMTLPVVPGASTK